jgi:hypothetical protein
MRLALALCSKWHKPSWIRKLVDETTQHFVWYVCLILRKKRKNSFFKKLLFFWCHSPQPGNPYWRGRLSTVDLLIKIACFGRQKNIVSVWKAADTNELVQGGELYWSFQFSKDSPPQHNDTFLICCHYDDCGGAGFFLRSNVGRNRW